MRLIVGPLITNSVLIKLAAQADEDLYSGYGDSGPLAVRLTHSGLHEVFLRICLT